MYMATYFPFLLSVFVETYRNNKTQDNKQELQGRGSMELRSQRPHPLDHITSSSSILQVCIIEKQRQGFSASNIEKQGLGLGNEAG